MTRIMILPFTSTSMVFWYGLVTKSLCITFLLVDSICLRTQCFLWALQLGNPETSDAEDWRGMVDYAWSHAVISDETHKIIRQSCNFDSNDTWSNDDCAEAVDELLKQYKEIDIYSLYTSVCIGDSASSDDKFTQIMFRRSSKMVNDFRFAESCWY
jgi:hypothetical protein